MKKILLSLFCICTALGSMAQYNNSTPFRINKAADDVNHISDMTKVHPPRGSKTRGTRYYSYISAIDQVDYFSAGLVFNNASFPPMWQDSTIQQLFSSGLGTINWSSFGASINPSATIFNDLATFGGTEQEITPNDPYTIDSIIIWGAYVTPNGTGAVPGDKITISVVKTGDTNQFIRSRFASQNNNNTRYLGNTADTTIRGVVPGFDSVKRIGGDPGKTVVTWDYVFTNADTGTIIKRFAMAPPSPINVPAGGIASMTMTFVSNDTWIPNVDSVGFQPGAKAHFRPRFFEEADGQAMTYRNNSENGGGHFCNSSLMFSFAPGSGYYPSILVESFNQVDFSQEHLDVDWVISSPLTFFVGTEDFTNGLANISTFPNPATDVLNIDLHDAKNNDVTVSLFTITGQKINTTTIAKGNTTTSIDIAAIPAGMYLCEFEMNGITKTTKITKR